MSQENVELVLRVLVEGRRDPTALFDALDDAVQWDAGFLDIPDSAGTWHGPAGVREFFRRWVGAFVDWDYEVEEVIDAEDSVVSRVHQWGRGKGSGVSVDWQFWQVWTLGNGKVVRFRAYATEAEALEAVGLREQAPSQENVEVVRSTLEAWREVTDTGELVDRFWDPDADYYPVRKFPEARACHGRDEIARFQADYLSAWDRYEAVINDLIAVGDDRVLAHTTVRGEGRESGVRLDGDLYHCFWLRHQRIFRVEDHLTLTGALHALGLGGDSLEAAGLRE